MTATPGSVKLDALCDHLAKHREAILAAWRRAARADPKQTTVRSLTRGQFDDHIPQVLDAFELQLRSLPGGSAARTADRNQKSEGIKHGLHRWQQGYRLTELVQEWGHLQLCLLEEVEEFAATHPGFDRASRAEANRQLITLVNEAISESSSQYERMQQAEAAGRMDDLDAALAEVSKLERQRSALIHEAVHDLNSNVFGVAVATRLLGRTEMGNTERIEFVGLLRQGMQSVTDMLGELTVLARLEAGRETREVQDFDAAALLAEVCTINVAVARERGLYLVSSGPVALAVEGDAGRVRRLLQNLLANAIKYTVQGGVAVSWGVEKNNWWMMVKDSGPGLRTGTDASLVDGLSEATASARESDEKTAADAGETSQVLAPPAPLASEKDRAPQQPGEGIGLSIVKRLCELLDASVEVASSAATGTTFRVVFPRRYAAE